MLPVGLIRHLMRGARGVGVEHVVCLIDEQDVFLVVRVVAADTWW